jgi:BirA family biotin operon repressor/biotin-[acetyl-CoA-carboxylase] ligase
MIGKTIIELDSVDSTNAYASRLMGEQDLADGSVVWAHEQFAGRGQNTNRWDSEAGKNLTLSVILRPRMIPPDRQFRINKAVALGVLDFIASSVTGLQGVFPAIKWPNDMYVGDKKVGGILIEHRIIGGVIDSTIAGIGLNINQTRFAPDIPNPVSLIHLLRHEVVLKEAMHRLLSFLNQYYLSLHNGDPDDLDRAYDEQLLGFHEWKSYLREGKAFEGRILGVDDFGRLKMELRSGELVAFGHKEFEYVG